MHRGNKQNIPWHILQRDQKHIDAGFYTFYSSETTTHSTRPKSKITPTSTLNTAMDYINLQLPKAARDFKQFDF